jgi:hypothetical protein
MSLFLRDLRVSSVFSALNSSSWRAPLSRGHASRPGVSTPKPRKVICDCLASMGRRSGGDAGRRRTVADRIKRHLHFLHLCSYNVP